jgi:hypothetical protein
VQAVLSSVQVQDRQEVAREDEEEGPETGKEVIDGINMAKLIYFC